MQKNIHGRQVLVDYDDLGEGVSEDELMAAFSDFEKALTAELLDSYFEQLATELLESAYQQDGEEADGELDALIGELKLVQITQFTDGQNLYFEAKKSFPDCRIIVQIDEDYEIDDIIVED